MMMMTALPTLTHDAQGDLNRYLSRVKNALRPHSTVDADEVERDIRGHIEAELSDAPSPVTAERLGSVLDRLGSPTQWVPADDLPEWRRVLIRLTAGPEDWRLAYLTLALLVGGPLLGIIVGPRLFFATIPLFFASILLARAGLALLDEKGEPVGARRWLFYPPLVVVCSVIAFNVFLVPPMIAAVATNQSGSRVLVEWLPAPFWFGLSLGTAVVAGTWWMVLGLTLARFRRAVQWVFWPFANGFERRHGHASSPRAGPSLPLCQARLSHWSSSSPWQKG